MIFYNDKTSFEECEKAAREFKIDEDTLARLFFQARNGAITYVLRNIEQYFDKHKLKVAAKWHESSYGHLTNITITLKDKYDHERLCFVKREVMWPEAKTGSQCLYRLENVQSSEYYHRKKPAKAEQFDDILGSPEFYAFLEKQVLGVNYPFIYKSQSSY